MLPPTLQDDIIILIFKEMTRSQRNSDICARFHSKNWQNWDFNPGLTPKSILLYPMLMPASFTIL